MSSHRHSHSSDIPKHSGAGIGCARANDLIYQILPSPIYAEPSPQFVSRMWGFEDGPFKSGTVAAKLHARARDTVAGLARGFIAVPRTSDSFSRHFGWGY